MIGSFCYRFADADHAAKMIEELMADDDRPTELHIDNCGPYMRPTGELDAEGFPITAPDPGHLVVVLMNDDVPIDGWDDWLHEPADGEWPRFFAGQEAVAKQGLEFVPAKNAKAEISNKVPKRPKMTDAEREQKKEQRRELRRAMNPRLITRAELDAALAEKDSTNKQIDGEPERRKALAAEIKKLNDRIASLASARKELADQIDATEDKEALQRLREQRTDVVTKIELLRKPRDRMDAMRDAIRDALPGLRDRRRELNDLIDELRAKLQAMRDGTWVEPEPEGP